MLDTAFTTPRSNKSRMGDVDQTPDALTGAASSQLNEKAKIRVDLGGPNGARCLIQNLPANAAVQYAHVYPRRIMSKDSHLLETIERNWKMGQNTLNLDTRRNVIKLNSNLHLLHDNPHVWGAWLLLPSEKTIEYYYDKVTKGGAIRPGPYQMRDKFCSYKIPGRNLVEYTFVVISDVMQHIPLVLQPDENLSEQNIKPHFFPFKTLPKIQSHLHPRFAILEAGRRVIDRVPSTGIINDKTWERIQTIYTAWTTWTPTKANDKIPKDDPSESNETEEQDPDASEGTGNRSVYSLRKRGRGNNDGSPTPSKQARNSKAGSAGGRRHSGGLRDNGLCDCGASCLSGETLYEHEAATGGQIWDKGHIINWVRDVVAEHGTDFAT